MAKDVVSGTVDAARGSEGTALLLLVFGMYFVFTTIKGNLPRWLSVVGLK